jgi:hypothetical protein
MSASAYINQRRVLTLAKASKVQYRNHQVSVDLIQGVIPCIPVLNQITYIPNPPCGCPPPIPITLIDGGFPGDNYPVLDGGIPGSHGRIIDCGVI